MGSKPDRSQAGQARASLLDRELAELCANHDVSLELIERSHDMDDLLDRVLDEYERRLARIPAEALDCRGAECARVEDPGLRGLIRFAAQATALKEKAKNATELRRSLEAQRQARRRLDEVLAALDAAILVVGDDGRIRHANRAAGALTGRGADDLVGRPAGTWLGAVGRGADGEVELDSAGEARRTMLVSRRTLEDGSGGEVVLLNDVTERDRRQDERHREEKDAALFHALGVLSHKINNPLTSLMGRAQILQMQEGQDPQVRKAAEVIESCSRRIAGYIRQLALVIEEGRSGDLERLLQLPERAEEPERS